MFRFILFFSHHHIQVKSLLWCDSKIHFRIYSFFVFELKTRESVASASIIIIKFNIHALPVHQLSCFVVRFAEEQNLPYFLYERSRLCAYYDLRVLWKHGLLHFNNSSSRTRTHIRTRTQAKHQQSCEYSSIQMFKKWRNGRKTETNSNWNKKKKKRERKKLVAHSLLHLLHLLYSRFLLPVLPLPVLDDYVVLRIVFWFLLLCDWAISLHRSCSFDGVGRVRCCPFAMKRIFCSNFEHLKPSIRSLYNLYWECNVLCAQIIRIPDDLTTANSMHYGKASAGSNSWRFLLFSFRTSFCRCRMIP